jgi:hypothetical protein
MNALLVLRWTALRLAPNHPRCSCHLANHAGEKIQTTGTTGRTQTKSKFDYKTAERIAEKAARPSIRKKKPWFDVQHIRDGFRFKTILNDLSDLPSIAEDMRNAGFKAIKVDTEKLLDPAMWGWRIVVFDLRLPNGQLVEYYLPVKEMEAAKKDGNHALFEKWRNRDQSTLTAEERREQYKDIETSVERYQQAWETYLTRTKQNEEDIAALLQEVRKLFGT